MAIVNALCRSFLTELLEAKHNFLLSGGDDFKLALYTSAATMGATTTAYATANEVASGSGYVTEGSSLTRIDPALDTLTSIVDFADETWTSSTITANGGLIYNETEAGDAAVVVLAFGGDKSSTNGDFTVQFPAAAAATAIIQLVAPA